MSDEQMKTENETIAQRVAEILAEKMQGPRVHGTTVGQPARIVTHRGLVCRNCRHTQPANHLETSKTPSAGGCGGDMKRTHDFYGVDTTVESVDALMPHHAIYVDGTVAYPS